MNEYLSVINDDLCFLLIIDTFTYFLHLYIVHRLYKVQGISLTETIN